MEVKLYNIMYIFNALKYIHNVYIKLSHGVLNEKSKEVMIVL